MSPFPFCVPPGVLAKQQPLNETIWATGDSLITGWEDEGGATADLWQSVDTDSDADYVNRITPVINSTVNLRFKLDTPTADPTSGQVVELKVRMEYLAPFDPLDTAPVAILEIREGTSTSRASTTGITVTTTPSEESVFMTPTEINSVTDWSDLYAQFSSTTTGNGVDQDVDYRIYRVRIIFSET
tara:strand:- start:9002 stop:9556 length:555 start_codon:yes stop_codon:yes gene_type:complete